MTELSPQAKRLLARLRNVDDPTQEERASGDAAVRGMLKAYGLVGVPPLAAGQASALGYRTTAGAGHPASGSLRIHRANDTTVTAARAVSGGSGAKLAWSIVGALVAALGLYAAQELPAPVPQLRSSAPPVQGPEGSGLAQPASAAPEAALGAAAPTLHGSTQREEQAEAAAPGGKAYARRSATKPALRSLSEELKFVASVDAELRSGGYERALQRLAQHKGSPALAEERAALRVLALCGRDNDAAAADARDRFLHGAPSSVLAARVRAACRTEPRP